MEVLITGAMAVVVGLATGQFVSIGFKNKKGNHSEILQKVEAIERVLPTLIPRTEVQEAINKVPPLVAQQVQSELTTLATQLTAQIPVQQPPAPVPTMPPAYEELNRQNQAKAAELENRLQEVTQMSIPQMEALAAQMPKRNRKPRQ